jgi:hypothetical protein
MPPLCSWSGYRPALWGNPKLKVIVWPISILTVMDICNYAKTLYGFTFFTEAPSYCDQNEHPLVLNNFIIFTSLMNHKGTLQLVVNADNVYVLGKYINIIQENTQPY